MSTVVSSYKKQKGPLLLEIIEQKEEETIYEIARKPYISCEFIPTSLISIIMQHHFPSAELVMSYHETHGIYKMLVSDLLVGSIKNWEYNRPPDVARCPDIARYIYHSRKPIDTMLYLTFNNRKEAFEVLDGIHRLTALKIIKEENSRPLELLCPGDFGSNNDAQWLYNQYIVVNIRFNASLGDLIEVFKNLNKSQNVPDLYIRDHKKEKRETIDTIVSEWIVKYKKHFSSSANPNTGHTNRNKFVDLLDKIYDKYQIDETSSNQLRQLLNDANNRVARHMPTRASLDIRVKCKETGCYLFLYKNEKLEDFI
jgi:hypothetical protein